MRIFLIGPAAFADDIFTLVDDDDAVLTRVSWSYNSVTGYAYGSWPRGSSNRPRPMHRVILERALGRKLKRGERVDHINRDKLDNRRANLRVATHRQNKQNTNKPAGKNGEKPTSQYKGVSWDKTRGLWMARIKADGRQINLGRFNAEEEAARAYDDAARKHFGEFANPNFS